MGKGLLICFVCKLSVDEGIIKDSHIFCNQTCYKKYLKDQILNEKRYYEVIGIFDIDDDWGEKTGGSVK